LLKIALIDDNAARGELTDTRVQVFGRLLFVNHAGDAELDELRSVAVRAIK
jgi:hypothetical protein